MSRNRPIIGIFAAALTAFAFAMPAAACGPRVEISFYEDADGDLFEITNKSPENWQVASLVLTLRGSRGRLVFDTADGGPGASMYQPFSADGRHVGFLGASPVNDGDEVLALTFSKFVPGATFSFVVDVDDRLVDSPFGQATVSDAEIEGASGEARMVKPDGEEARAKGAFGREGKAILGGGGLCA